MPPTFTFHECGLVYFQKKYLGNFRRGPSSWGILKWGILKCVCAVLILDSEFWRETHFWGGISYVFLFFFNILAISGGVFWILGGNSPRRYLEITLGFVPVNCMYELILDDLSISINLSAFISVWWRQNNFKVTGLFKLHQNTQFLKIQQKSVE